VRWGVCCSAAARQSTRCRGWARSGVPASVQFRSFGRVWVGARCSRRPRWRRSAAVAQARDRRATAGANPAMAHSRAKPRPNGEADCSAIGRGDSARGNDAPPFATFALFFLLSPCRLGASRPPQLAPAGAPQPDQLAVRPRSARPQPRSSTHSDERIRASLSDARALPARVLRDPLRGFSEACSDVLQPCPRRVDGLPSRSYKPLHPHPRAALGRADRPPGERYDPNPLAVPHRATSGEHP
jgi:hypothetical protein